jgi:hypothetical protein
VVERACVDDVAFRVIAANQRPDHCTIARFRQRHEAALAGLFGVRCSPLMARRCTPTHRSTRTSTATRSPGRFSLRRAAVTRSCAACSRQTLGKQLYGKRQVTIEPVFANTKSNRRIDRFLRREDPPAGRNGG